MATIVPISQAKIRLSELVASTHAGEGSEVVLLKHGRPSAVILSVDVFNRMQEMLDDYEDRLSLYERDHDTVPFGKVVEMIENGTIDSL